VDEASHDHPSPDRKARKQASLKDDARGFHIVQNNLLGDDVPIVVVLKACGMQVRSSYAG
jgi:hypothetical protein